MKDKNNWFSIFLIALLLVALAVSKKRNKTFNNKRVYRIIQFSNDSVILKNKYVEKRMSIDSLCFILKTTYNDGKN